MAILELAVDADISGPSKAVEAFERFGEKNEMETSINLGFQLALDEMLTNVVSYAFDPAAESPSIILVVELSPARVTATISDNGRPFNPLSDAGAPELEGGADERPIGGLGIHLTKNFVDSMSYIRKGGQNVLTLIRDL